ncbi:hypothetical protein, partial [Mesorhizobium sp.]|uniref:hypothetical protein n=1 Tax=Mesorhizobium sp. TaxID=1871066 RepID=UPI0025C5148F
IDPDPIAVPFDFVQPIRALWDATDQRRQEGRDYAGGNTRPVTSAGGTARPFHDAFRSRDLKSANVTSLSSHTFNPST